MRKRPTKCGVPITRAGLCAGDGTRCDPLTISDAFSRFLLRCRVVDKTDGARAQMVFDALFREYGLPEAIRTDNGAPFASPAPGGLSRLSVWWIRLGIRHERIQAGCPEQNGRHERMHQSLKQEVASPPKANLKQQQEALEWFQREYNQVRPHQALQYRTPAELYVGSARAYSGKVPELVYPDQMELRRVWSSGQMKWQRQDIFISRVLAGETVGLLEKEENFYELYYGPLLLGWFDAAEQSFVADPGPGPRSGAGHRGRIENRGGQ